MIYCILTLFLSQAHAENYFAAPASFKGRTAAAFVSREGCRVADVLACRKGECAALRAIHGKIPWPKQTPYHGVGSPSAAFCAQLGGRDRIYYDSRDNESAVCLFADGSSIFTWDLMRKLQQGSR